jgi:hypothetical protein
MELATLKSPQRTGVIVKENLKKKAVSGAVYSKKTA